MNFSAADLHNDRLCLREFVERLQKGEHTEDEYKKWEVILQLPTMWEAMRTCVPSLDINKYARFSQRIDSLLTLYREDIPVDSDSPLTRLQTKLRDAGLLRQSKPSIEEDTAILRRSEQWQDYGYLLLPPLMHKPWHDLVAEEFGIQQTYTNTADSSSTPNVQSDPSLLAFQDRVFHKLCSLWKWGHGLGVEQKPAYQNFVREYRRYRGEAM